VDAFQAKCLREIVGIKPSYFSRVSDEAVLSSLDARPLSKSLLAQQLLYFVRLARTLAGAVLRDSVFKLGSVSLKVNNRLRCEGRPRDSWAAELHALAMQVAGSSEALRSMLINSPAAEAAWHRAERQHCSY
jgi:hypothetical protein